MIIVLGSVTVRSDSLAQALALSREHVGRSRGEPGCIAHAVHQDAEDPRRLVFVEQWTDRAALQRHFLVPESRNFVKALGALAIGPPSMTIYDATPVT
jgi:quinol monooxygenase YgiN